jgi:hypothetical protein
MRLPSSVIEKMRGLGGAALVAAAVAATGCGGGSSAPKPVAQPQPIVIAQDRTVIESDDGTGGEQDTQVQTVQHVDMEHVPAPCGRG